MAMSKVGGIAVGLVMVGVGAWQVMHGMQGCSGKRELSWSATRASSIQLGDFSIKIPDGWRDAAEAHDQKLEELLSTQPGAHALVREDFDGQVVLVKTGPTEPTATPPCDQIATTLAKTEGSTASAIAPRSFGADPGCRWNARRGDTEMTYNMRFHGSQILLVACSGAGTLCEPALAGVTLRADAK